jgi:hypothetical protein
MGFMVSTLALDNAIGVRKASPHGEANFFDATHRMSPVCTDFSPLRL